MSEHIKIRVVVEEVVVDFDGNISGMYLQEHITATIKETVTAALKLHAARHGAEQG